MKRLIAIITVFTLFSYPLIASQIHLQPYEKIAKDVKNVCILKVDKVEREDKYRQFKDGEKRLISYTIIVSGTVTEHIFGDFKAKKIVTKLTSIVPIAYSEDGKQAMGFSPILPISGYEHNVEIGKEYIFSYSWFDESQPEQFHMRMDLLKDKAQIIEILKKNKKSN